MNSLGGDAASNSLHGTDIKIVSKYGIMIKSLLSVSLTDDSLFLYWRSFPEKVGCEMSFLRRVSISPTNGQRLDLVFADFDMQVEFESPATCELLCSILSSLILEASAFDKEHFIQAQSSMSAAMYTQSLRHAGYQISTKQELMYQLCVSLRMKEGGLLVEKVLSKISAGLLRAGFTKWTVFLRELNMNNMNEDKARWRLHAAANQDVDLQAWYHSVFFHEVYRLRGPFWFRDAVLPVYRNSYDLVDNALSPLEEAALAHVLCSPETSYGDVAGQMFVVQAILRPELFAVFQKLAAQGMQVIKYPRSGRPAKKMFRFSFVEGNIYLTWRGKFGNQGVDLGEVSSIAAGISSEVLKKAAQPGRADQYLSVICAGRSVDLCFESVQERDEWKGMLEMLARKEHGELVGVEPLAPPAENDLFEWLLIYSAMGEGFLPVAVRKSILRRGSSKLNRKQSSGSLSTVSAPTPQT